MIVLDTSGLLAIVDADQRDHAAVHRAITAEPGPFLLSPFVLAELDYLLLTRLGVAAETDMLREVIAGVYDLVTFGGEDLAKAVSLLERYQDLKIGLAEASVAVIAAKMRTTRLLTLDHRHFRAIRPLWGRPSPSCPPMPPDQELDGQFNGYHACRRGIRRVRGFRKVCVTFEAPSPILNAEVAGACTPEHVPATSGVAPRSAISRCDLASPYVANPGSVRAMAPSSISPRAPFGRMLTAMVTPMTADRAVDDDGAARLATYLVDEMRNDGLVVSGTTGEAPTTSDIEKERLLRSVVEAVGDRATILAGVGTNDTAHTVELARQAARAGADGLLVVTPYYNKPPQEGLIAHFTTVADATELPVILYDIPGRTATAIATDTLLRLAEHERIVAVKDAKDDLGAASIVMARTDLAYYCGTDMLNLPQLAIGAAGFISVVGHVVGADLHEMIDAHEAGDVARALAIHRRLLPVYTGMFRTQGVITTKAALAMLGLPGGPVRPPLVDASPALRAQLREDLLAGAVKVPEGGA